ncbi:transcriptional repressor TraM [Neoaquamicrobium sediminum]|uniref:transcriptional repressor TraM n=1 Tax=Neoaquamicrobium sediminum TaxID=1849104 RepID=UPI001566C587|nr:transcriptional repressor TraM [Mesorhizobium sediminum]NRC57203.1 hypothetical protein [Mesorhizobium sediminum]
MSGCQSDRHQAVAPSARRSISSLLDGVPESELEQLAIEVILQNRRHLQHAQDLFERLEAHGPDADDNGELQQLRHNYHLALITLNGHHEVVSAVVGALGHVPDVPADDADDNTAASTLN